MPPKLCCDIHLLDTPPGNLYSESSNLAKCLSLGHNERTAPDSWAEDHQGLFVLFFLKFFFKIFILYLIKPWNVRKMLLLFVSSWLQLLLHTKHKTTKPKSEKHTYYCLMEG